MLERTEQSGMPLISTVALSVVLWFGTFYLTFSTFWIKISCSAATLAILSVFLQPVDRARLKINGKVLVMGILSAALLYGVLAGQNSFHGHFSVCRSSDRRYLRQRGGDLFRHYFFAAVLYYRPL